MSQKYPFPCTDCGFCCLVEVCPVGQLLMHVPDAEYRQECPALEWEGTKSRCGLFVHPEAYCHPDELGSPVFFFLLDMLGQGCCYSGGVKLPETQGQLVRFDSLPERLKEVVVERYRQQGRSALIQLREPRGALERMGISS